MLEQGNYGTAVPHMHALAYLYDHLADFPTWVQHLTPKQIDQLAMILIGWQRTTGEYDTVQSIEDLEKREFIRALATYGGDVCEAAKALGIGKTTLYRRLKEWGYSPSHWRLISQAAALAYVRPTSDVRVRTARAASAV